MDPTGPPLAPARAGDLVVSGLSWRPHGRLRPTLDAVDLDLAPGERVLLVGASGSGKSTLLRALAGLLDPSLGEQTGRVALGEGTPGRRPGQVGLLLQEPTHTVVAEYAGRDAAFGPENTRQPPAAVRDRAAASLAAVGFPYGADRRTDALSGGELQRLSLAGTLALDPEVLLLDEPTAMLDPPSAAVVRGAVQDAVRARGLTCVVVEHRLDGWWDFCGRTVLIGPGGRVLADGPTAEVLADRRPELLAAGVWVPGAAVPDAAPLSWHGPSGAGTPEPDPEGVAQPERPSTALDAAGLAVTAPGRQRRPRLLASHLDLHLAPGEALALTGPSGAGKSTLLRTLAGFQPPARGEVRLGGRDVRELVRRPAELARAVAWLPQHLDHLVTATTVRAEVLATSEQLYADQPELLTAARDRADRVLAALGLSALHDADPFQLSVGEQRRMGLAAVVVHGPRLLLLDEPTVGQDRHTWAAVLGVVRALQGEGTAVLASTHDGLFAAALGQTVSLGDGLRSEDAVGPAAYRLTEVVEPGSPPSARANPLALLAVALGAAVGSFFLRDWRAAAVVLALVVLLSPLAVRGLRPVALRLVPVGLAALTVGWSTLLLGDLGPFAREAWPVAAREVLRICYLVVPGVLLVPSLPPSRLGDALAQRARLPHRAVAAAAAALLRVQQLLDVWRQMTEIRTVRALHPGRSLPRRVRASASMTFALLVWSLRAAQQMALSMDARGFARAHRRTFALASGWRAVDWLCLLVAGVLLVAPVVLDLPSVLG